MNEPDIIINGHQLNSAQAMAVRVAITSFFQEMWGPTPLGEDEIGIKLQRGGYRDRLAEVLKIVMPKPMPEH